MPLVQLTSLFNDIDENTDSFISVARKKIIDAAFCEVGGSAISCQIPEKEIRLTATKEGPVDWDALHCYQQSANQPVISFHEQKFAIEVAKDAIEKIWKDQDHGVYGPLCYAKGLICNDYSNDGLL
eukprot:11498080-Ditylum_brightwellii.AAC.1